jgi:tetratricopeptide (TPR) repeat protein
MDEKLRQAGTSDLLTDWQRMLDRDPVNAESARKFAALTVEDSRRRAGLAAGPNQRGPADVVRSQRPGVDVAPFAITLSFDEQQIVEAYLPPASGPGYSLTRIQQFEAAIRDNPSRAELYLELARLYLDKGRDYEAERLLVRGGEATGRDPRVVQFGEDVILQRLEKKLAAARREIEIDDTPQTRAASEQVAKDRDRAEIEIFTVRCKREPDNLALRYELGRRLRQAGKLDEAMRHLEASLPEPRTRCVAALALGECCELAGRVADALRYFRLAADSSAGSDPSGIQTAALLRASELAAERQLVRLARRYLAWLLRIDPEHRGAAVLAEQLDRQAPTAH